MTAPIPWEPAFSLGHPLIDAQHQALLARCQALAPHAAEAGAGPADTLPFDQALAEIRALAHEHFQAEATLLCGDDPAAQEDHRIECEEFEYLLDDIVTTQNFDPQELQRFLTVWWVGHITAVVSRWRPAPPG